MNKSIRRITFGAIAATIHFSLLLGYLKYQYRTQGYVNLGDSMIYFSASFARALCVSRSRYRQCDSGSGWRICGIYSGNDCN
jgi:hypothetical protein